MLEITDSPDCFVQDNSGQASVPLTIHAKEYAYYDGKAPRLSEDRRAQGHRRSVWYVSLSGAMNKRDETDKIDQADTHKCQPARRAHAALEAAFSKSS